MGGCRRTRPAGVVAAALAAISLAGVHPALGQGYTDEELRALPRVCLAQKFISGSLRNPIVPEAERTDWAKRLGPSYEHYHHFCWALIDMRRANGSGRPQDRNSNYLRAVANFEYVQKNATSAFPLLPEVYLRKGLALRHIGQDGEAAREFLAAIELKRDYTPAYSSLVDLYADLDDYESARKILELGITVVPDSKILAAKKAEIEGRLAARR